MIHFQSMPPVFLKKPPRLFGLNSHNFSAKKKKSLWLKTMSFQIKNPNMKL